MDQSRGAGIYCYGTWKRFISALGGTPQYSSINARFWYSVYFPIVIMGTGIHGFDVVICADLSYNILFSVLLSM
jgi:hypothetical protein